MAEQSLKGFGTLARDNKGILIGTVVRGRGGVCGGGGGGGRERERERAQMLKVILYSVKPEHSTSTHNKQKF